MSFSLSVTDAGRNGAWHLSISAFWRKGVAPAAAADLADTQDIKQVIAHIREL